jgi:hypothetical protein
MENMTSRKRTLAACAFLRPDRIPRFDNFQDYTKEWEARFGPAESLSDLEIIVPDETPFLSRARRIREEAGWIYEVDGWGRTVRRRPDAFFVEVLQAPIPVGADPDSVRFDSPGLDVRYAAKSREEIERIKRQRALFAKTGGPFLRTSFVRGETQFLLDIAGDPPLEGRRSTRRRRSRGRPALRPAGNRGLDLRRHGVQRRADVQPEIVRARFAARVSPDDRRLQARRRAARFPALRRRHPPVAGHARGRRN